MNNKRITFILFISLLIISGFLTLSGFFNKNNNLHEKSNSKVSSNFDKNKNDLNKKPSVDDSKNKNDDTQKQSIKNKVLSENGVIRVKNIDCEDEKYQELSIVNIKNKIGDISDKLENELKEKAFKFLRKYITILDVKEPDKRLESIKDYIDTSYYEELKKQLVAESISPKGYYVYRIPTSMRFSNINKVSDNEFSVDVNVTSDWFNSDMELEDTGTNSSVDYSILFKNIEGTWKICMMSETHEIG